MALVTDNDTALDAEIQTLQELALGYAKRGWAVFPVYGVTQEFPEGPFICDCAEGPKCEHTGKHPLTGRGFLEATTNLNTIKALWEKFPNANIGVATGEGSGVFVMDVDGPSGVDSLDGKLMPDTLKASTGRTDGGIHHYFRWPGFKVKNAVKLLPGIDVRADGGYAILPGSQHESGKFYEWLNDAEVADAPQWLLDKLRENAKGPTPKAAPKSVVKGKRNDHLAARTGQLVRTDTLSVEQIRAAIHVANAEDLAEPLARDEVDTIVDSVTRHDPENPLLTLPKTDTGNAERLAFLHKARARYLGEEGLWRIYDDIRGAWLEDSGLGIRRLAKETARQTQIAAANIPTSVAGRDVIMAWAQSLENGRAQREMIQAAEAELEISREEFDTHDTLFNCANGVVDLTTGELLPHSRDYFSTRWSPVAYDPEARSDVWESVLDHATRGNQEHRAFVQAAAGYTLTGLTTEEAVFVAEGPAGSGKSTILEALAAAMGTNAVTVAIETFLVSRNAANGSSASENVLRLDGPRMALTGEPESGRQLRNGFLKSATGGDRLNARGLYSKKSRDFKPKFKLWIMCNEWPATDADDTGVWRRIHKLPLGPVW